MNASAEPLAAHPPPAPVSILRRLALANILVILLVAGLTALSLYRSYQVQRERAENATRNMARVLETHIAAVVDKTDFALRSAVLEAQRQTTADYRRDWQQDAIEESFLAALLILVTLGSSGLLYRGWLRQRRADEARAGEARRNRLLLQTASDGIHILDGNGGLVEVNDAFCTQLAYTRDELLGMNIADIDAVLSREEIAENLRQVFAGKRLFETRHRRKDGTTIDVEVGATGGEIDGRRLIFATARDVTGRKLAEIEQKRLKRTLQLLGDSNIALLRAEREESLLPGICRLIVEEGGYLMAWVGFAERDAGKTVLPVAQSGCEEGYLDSIRVSWGDTEPGRGPTGVAIRSGRTQINHNVLDDPRLAPWRAAAIQRGYRSCIALPLVGDGIVLGALNIYAAEPEAFGAEEIGLLEKLADNLAFGIEGLRAKRQLLAAHQELQAFTYAASHDLKAPLRGIDSFSGLLERQYRDRLEGDGLMFLAHIRRSAARMATLIDDLLAYSRIEHGSGAMRPVSLTAAASAVLAELREEIRQCGAEVKLALPAATLLADPSGLAQVLRNLVGNALKYAARARTPSIEIGGEEKDGRCRVWVRDNGIGFDMAYSERIFEVFRRLHTYDEYPGSGIGLALVRKAMERMGGRVWAQSAPGEGATFFLELPSARELQPQAEGESASRSSARDLLRFDS